MRKGTRIGAAVAALVVAVAVLAALFLSGNLGFGKHAAGGQITQAWISQELSLLKPTTNSSVGFSAFWQSASYGNINSVSPSIQSADLSMLVSTGASCVRIDPNVPESGQLSADVQAVKDAGKCLIFADGGSQSYYSHPLDWSSFQQAWVQRVSALASEYHPDYYIVIKEPGWYVPMVSDATSNPQFQNASVWVGLTAQLVAAVHQASPSTMIGVSIGADVGSYVQFYNSFLTGVEALDGISFIGFDIYNIPAFTYTQSFLASHGSGGKAVWIAEAWSGTGSVAFDSARASLDKSWMLLLYYFAQHIHAVNVIPFFTGIFASYSRTPDYSQRTPVFYEFQALARQFGTTLG